MYDSFNRSINYLRISVTDRCNFRCFYCFTDRDPIFIEPSELLSPRQIIAFVKTATTIGIDKIRITGGEPLLRDDILNIISGLSKISAIKELTMTTNGVFLHRFAPELKKAGLSRVNISLDTMDPEKFKIITNGGNIEDVLTGIESAVKAGLTPVKINCVINDSPSEPDAMSVAEYCKQTDLELRFIHKMNLEEGIFSVVEGGTGGLCKECNRLRLTANGKLKPCLFSEIEYDIKKLGNKKAILTAIKNKPVCGQANRVNKFNNIGG